MSILLLSRALVKEVGKAIPPPPEVHTEEEKTLLEVAGALSLSLSLSLFLRMLISDVDAVSVLASNDALQKERGELEKLKADHKKIEARIDHKEIISPTKVCFDIIKKEESSPQSKTNTTEQRRQTFGGQA